MHTLRFPNVGHNKKKRASPTISMAAGIAMLLVGGSLLVFIFGMGSPRFSSNTTFVQNSSQSLSNIRPNIVVDQQNKDYDGDGLSDVQELKFYHTDPIKYDSDGDGIGDGDEVRYGKDPLDARSYPTKIDEYQDPFNDHTSSSQSQASEEFLFNFAQYFDSFYLMIYSVGIFCVLLIANHLKKQKNRA